MPDRLVTPPGFFGKVRQHGDFVARRLPPSMRTPLDDWLQRALLHSRHDLGPAWLPVWLNSPLWRFALAPGVCGPHAWAGVMMPSLDRVNRCFPLMVAQELAAPPSLAACLGPHDEWFRQVEDLALSSLDEAFSLDAFDAALLALQGAPPARTPEDPAAHGGAIGAASVARLDGQRLPALAHCVLDGRSAWWTDGSGEVAPALAVCTGLPRPAAFAALLDGRWAERGWQAR